MTNDATGEGETFTPPLFVLFADGTLWAYDAISDISLKSGAIDLDGFRAWDSVGHRIVLAGIENDGLELKEVSGDTSGRGDLQKLLRESLRLVNVQSVDALSFEELVDKASIRMIAPRPISRTELIGGGFFEGLMQFLSRP